MKQLCSCELHKSWSLSVIYIIYIYKICYNILYNSHLLIFSNIKNKFGKV